MSEMTKQVGEVQCRWHWVERAVWTDRMLNALETGLKGACWFSLIDKVYSERNLNASYSKVARNKGSAGVDHVTVKRFGDRLDEEIARLHRELKEGTYQAQAIRRVQIPKPGSKEKRPLGIPTVRDRVVQAAVRAVLEPIFERDFSSSSYGFRPGLGCKDALRRVDNLLNDGYQWVVDLDIRKYFDTIPHDKLMALIAKRIGDSRVLGLIEMYLKQPVFEELKEVTPEEGSPQGAVLSPLLANIYLSPLDLKMTRGGYEMVRYADDIVVLCKTEEEAIMALEEMRQWMESAGLTIHPEKTRIVDVAGGEGFAYLGYWFQKDKLTPSRVSYVVRPESLKHLRQKLRLLTRRANGKSIEETVRKVSSIVRGWYEYYKHSRLEPLRRIDAWVRMRLRSILRQRNGGKGRGRGLDNLKWPNVYFRKLGLFSMVTARNLLVQSSCR